MCAFPTSAYELDHAPPAFLRGYWAAYTARPPIKVAPHCSVLNDRRLSRRHRRSRRDRAPMGAVQRWGHREVEAMTDLQSLLALALGTSVLAGLSTASAQPLPPAYVLHNESIMAVLRGRRDRRRVDRICGAQAGACRHRRPPRHAAIRWRLEQRHALWPRARVQSRLRRCPLRRARRRRSVGRACSRRPATPRESMVPAVLLRNERQNSMLVFTPLEGER